MRFVGQDWEDTAMGFIAGYNELGCGKREIGAQGKKGGLTKWMVPLFHLRTDDDERMIETSIVLVRME